MRAGFDGVDVFVAVVEAGNFAAAAAKLRLTRSAVGKGVARLEARLNTRLFHRTTRSLHLTPQGQSYYERCRRALAELAAADDELEAGRQEPIGQVKLTMPIIIGRHLIGPMLFELCRQHPGLSFDLSMSDRRADLIEEGIDLAVRSGTLDDSATFAARPLGRQLMATYASPSYLLSHPRPSSLEELLMQREEHRYVGYARQGWRQPWRFTGADGQVISIQVDSSFVCDSLDLVLDGAITGWGLARAPIWMAAEHVAAGRLVRVFDEAQPFGYELNALWPRMRSMPVRLRVVIDMLLDRLPGLIGSLK